MAEQDATEIERAGVTKLVGSTPDGTETNPAKVSDAGEVHIRDTHDNGGLDKVLVVASGTPQELKVGASRKEGRKYVVFEGLTTKIKWGFTNSSQSFDVFKSQILMVPVGENTEVWFSYDSGSGDGEVAIGEIS